jgi:hypothetical protein
MAPDIRTPRGAVAAGSAPPDRPPDRTAELAASLAGVVGRPVPGLSVAVADALSTIRRRDVFFATAVLLGREYGRGRLIGR